MSHLVVQATEEGLNVAAELMEQAGLRPGRLVELVPLPDADEIHREASRHVVWSLGMRIAVGVPRWSDGCWVVDLFSADGCQQIGTLFYDAHGQLDEERSTTRKTLK
jgi:hypothetical protein